MVTAISAALDNRVYGYSHFLEMHGTPVEQCSPVVYFEQDKRPVLLAEDALDGTASTRLTVADVRSRVGRMEERRAADEAAARAKSGGRGRGRGRGGRGGGRGRGRGRGRGVYRRTAAATDRAAGVTTVAVCPAREPLPQRASARLARRDSAPVVEAAGSEMATDDSDGEYGRTEGANALAAKRRRRGSLNAGIPTGLDAAGQLLAPDFAVDFDWEFFGSAANGDNDGLGGHLDQQWAAMQDEMYKDSLGGAATAADIAAGAAASQQLPAASPLDIDALDAATEAVAARCRTPQAAIAAARAHAAAAAQAAMAAQAMHARDSGGLAVSTALVEGGQPAGQGAIGDGVGVTSSGMMAISRQRWLGLQASNCNLACERELFERQAQALREELRKTRAEAAQLRGALRDAVDAGSHMPPHVLALARGPGREDCGGSAAGREDSSAPAPAALAAAAKPPRKRPRLARLDTPPQSQFARHLQVRLLRQAPPSVPSSLQPSEVAHAEATPAVVAAVAAVEAEAAKADLPAVHVPARRQAPASHLETASLSQPHSPECGEDRPAVASATNTGNTGSNPPAAAVVEPESKGKATSLAAATAMAQIAAT